MKKYSFNYEEYSGLKEQLYPTIGLLKPTIDIDSFTEEHLNQLINEVKKIMENPIITEEEMPESKKEVITIFSEQTNKTLNEVFHNDDLVFFGHGGAAKEIIEDEFKCMYSSILSHFIPLECSNESLSILKEWPHRSANNVAIMALNKHEYNPIYKEREKENTYDTEIYSISNEYFVGYYNKDNDEFILNPNFKERHDYDPNCELYQNEQFEESFLHIDGPDLVKKYYRSIDKIGKIMLFSSLKSMLDEIGYKKVCQSILHEINKLKDYQELMTPEYIEEQKNKENNKVEFIEAEFSNDDEDPIWDSGDEIDWGEEFTSSPKKM